MLRQKAEAENNFKYQTNFLKQKRWYQNPFHSPKICPFVHFRHMSDIGPKSIASQQHCILKIMVYIKCCRLDIFSGGPD